MYNTAGAVWYSTNCALCLWPPRYTESIQLQSHQFRILILQGLGSLSWLVNKEVSHLGVLTDGNYAVSLSNIIAEAGYKQMP